MRAQGCLIFAVLWPQNSRKIHPQICCAEFCGYERAAVNRLISNRLWRYMTAVCNEKTLYDWVKEPFCIAIVALWTCGCGVIASKEWRSCKSKVARLCCGGIQKAKKQG